MLTDEAMDGTISRVFSLWAALSIPVLLAGCDSRGPMDRIAGDWFLCTSKSCNDLDSGGYRFEADGRLASLRAPGDHLEQAERYCSRSEGEFTYDDHHLVLKLSGSAESRRFSVEDGQATMVVVGYALDDSGNPMDLQLHYVLVEPRRWFGSCPEEIKCSSQSCAGCCSASLPGVCRDGNTQDTCGKGGAACAFCGPRELCRDQACQ